MRTNHTTPQQESLWRNQIASKVAAHKARGGRAPAPNDAPETPAHRQRAEDLSQRAIEKIQQRLEARIAREEAERREREELERFFAEFNKPVEPTPAPVERTRPIVSDSNLIQFPSAPALANAAVAAAPALAPELEHPSADQLTIFEAIPEAEPEPESAWYPALRLDEHPDYYFEEAPISPEAQFELPLKVAPFELRCWAGMIDAALVLACSVSFAVIFYSLQQTLPATKVMLAFAAAITWLLWTFYNVLFLAYSGQTPGLKAMRLGISDFEDRVPDARRRVWRALCLALCPMSFGVGFGWALFDDDRLAWHDRMTRTFPRQLAQP